MEFLREARAVELEFDLGNELSKLVCGGVPAEG
jgi:hypothetical protein